jgi:hypothetical protein
MGIAFCFPKRKRARHLEETPRIFWLFLRKEPPCGGVMVSRFDAALAAICAQGGWSPPETDAEGRARFALREMEFTLSAPDDRHLCFLYPLPVSATPAPEETPGGQARKLARMAAASAWERTAILSFCEGAFYLHAIVDMAATGVEEIPAFCQDFLNDCDWWRQNRSFFT